MVKRYLFIPIITCIDKTNMKYDIKKDHANIKKQIKTWEHTLDHLINALYVDEPINEQQKDRVIQHLEVISHEMMTINI